MSTAAWPIGAGLYVAGACPEDWGLPRPPHTAVSLRRRTPHLADYGPLRPAVLMHRPWPYWQLPDPAGVLDDLVTEIEAAAEAGTVVVHCALGLDRAPVAAMAVLLHAGHTGPQVLARYAQRGVRLPRPDALDQLSSYALSGPGKR
jgi:Protein-tyrosine phosphatase